ncbi:hypothetical protein Nepgr_022020 [Nepenthes gracilis]|uniref:Glycosyltransferase family 92 protein n=1 Tax=Nepenthes gracilis TaxID=150966 RepID=A0AAD3T036_NEPGR|nr:hypothetical protein Nepgr_022020 [Nepenthes gracilis]
MAGLHFSLRPSSSFPTSHPNPLSSQNFLSRLILLLVLLPLSLAIFSFFLQWRSGSGDPTTIWSPELREFPGKQSSSVLGRDKMSAGCATDVLGQRSSPTFPYHRDWKFNYNASNLRPKICITTSTSAGLEQVLPWIFYHKVIGIANFFLFVEGKAASLGVSEVLEGIPGVKVIYRTRELEKQQSESRIWNETWLSGFFYKPCNYELFVKQTLNMEMAIVMARDAGMEWIIHLDTDELVHPAGTLEYSVRELLSDIPTNVDMVVFPNYEGSVERDNIKEPFSEVSMFKKNYDHLSREAYFGHYTEATRENPNYFLTYGNGKSAARIQDHLRPNGAHRWHNYMKIPNEMRLDEAAILHYTYSKYSDLTTRRDRCGCKPTKKDVKRCFMLEFDRDAFIIASIATEQEMLRWYQDHVVWMDKALKQKLLKNGILTRIYTPMVIIQGLRESGVFSSVIASARAALSAVNLSSAGVIKSSSIAVSRREQVFSRKMGDSQEFHATARKMLEVEKLESHSPAVPPLYPPSMVDFSDAEMVTLLRKASFFDP